MRTRKAEWKGKGTLTIEAKDYDVEYELVGTRGYKTVVTFGGETRLPGLGKLNGQVRFLSEEFPVLFNSFQGKLKLETGEKIGIILEMQLESFSREDFIGFTTYESQELKSKLL